MTIYNLISIYFLIMIYAAVYWAVHIRALNETGYALVIQLLSWAFFIYIMGYTLQLNSVTEAQMLFWNSFQYLGIPYVSALWLLSGVLYTNRFSKNKIAWSLFIFVIPVITMFLRFTNDWHHFYFAAITFVDVNGKLLLERTYGPWMVVQTVHSLSMILITLSLYLQEFLSHEDNRKKVILISLASLVAALGLVFSFENPLGIAIDYMAVFLPFSCFLVVVAISRYDFLETKAKARNEAFESNRDAFVLVSMQNKIIDYNLKAKRLFEKLGINLVEGRIESILKDAPGFLAGFLSDGDMTIKVVIENRERIFEISTQKIDSLHISHGTIKIICDVTKAYDLNKSLQYQAMMDALSGLYNRRAFMQKSEEIRMIAQENSQSLHLLMMDLDHFKNVNDRFGHQMGDRVITTIGSMLKECFDSDALIARLGGEEFAVLLTDYDDSAVEEKAGSFIRDFAAHVFSERNQLFHVTVSIGIAKKSNASQSLEHLIHMADQALYQAKDQGRNRVVAYSGEWSDYSLLSLEDSRIRKEIPPVSNDFVR
ncbi:diguanylate cyclase [Eubacteriaceae bacterium ES2]|nr:diguanylate cyclase [Eubacteriaceae bacterium ES2]